MIELDSLPKKETENLFYIQRTHLSVLSPAELRTTDIKVITTLVPANQFVYVTNKPVDIEGNQYNYGNSYFQLEALRKQFPFATLYSYRVTIGVPKKLVSRLSFVDVNSFDVVNGSGVSVNEYRGVHFDPTLALEELDIVVYVAEITINGAVGEYQKVELLVDEKKESNSKAKRIYLNRQRQQNILKENGGRVLGMHRTATENLLSILLFGLKGADSSYYQTGYRQDVFDAVWFEEETELGAAIRAGQAAKYRQGFVIIYAQLQNPSTDPEGRPFWHVPKVSTRSSDISLKYVKFFDSLGNFLYESDIESLRRR